MNLCDSGHDEICFEGLNCPLCDMEAQKDEEIEKLNDNISDLENKISEMEKE